MNDTVCFQKTVAWPCRLVMAYRLTMAFFNPRLPGLTRSFDCSKVSVLLWRRYVSSMVSKGCKNSSGLWLNNAKPLEVVTRLLVSNRNTHLADCFFMSKYSLKCDVPIQFRNYTLSHLIQHFHYFHPSSNSIPCILSTISDMVTSFGQPKRLASLLLVWPQWNSVNHLLNIEIDGSESP